ncbi:helix-turn-helix domain-containing protein [Spirillospora albida]|uniref:helix-turn-helix domain-containing protein n=1 Tax=Spirillospora albida TaxID=58123 RepID=UPI00068C9530|nr:helix-turn-helix transcriptional regulator [Spirillospora albida]
MPEAAEALLTELRALKEEAGYDLRSLERKTHASRSSWGRWLSGETWIPADAVTALARLCGADHRRLEILWELADTARRSPATGPAEESPATPESVAPEPVAGEPAVPAEEVSTEPAAAEPTALVEEISPPPERPRRVLFAAALVGCAVTAGAAGVVLGASLQSNATEPPAPPSPHAASAHRPAATITRSEVIARARAWHPRTPRRVPYDQAANYQGYRTDGSGYASMALGLPKPGPNSASLVTSYCRPIAARDLRPGDLIINPTGGAGQREVMIFERWTTPARTAYRVFQQRRGYGTDHLVLRDVTGSAGGHRPCRPTNVREDPTG